MSLFLPRVGSGKRGDRYGLDYLSVCQSWCVCEREGGERERESSMYRHIFDTYLAHFWQKGNISNKNGSFSTVVNVPFVVQNVPFLVENVPFLVEYVPKCAKISNGNHPWMSWMSLAKVASRPKFWPRPRPRGFGLGLASISFSYYVIGHFSCKNRVKFWNFVDFSGNNLKIICC